MVLFSMAKSILAMDSYIIIKEFMDELGTVVPWTQNASYASYLHHKKPVGRNFIVRMGCLFICSGILMTELQRYRINLKDRGKIEDGGLLLPKRKDKDKKIKSLNKTNFKLFSNSLGIILIGLTSKSKISIAIFTGSGMIAICQRLLKSRIKQNYYTKTILKFTGAVLTAIGWVSNIYG